MGASRLIQLSTAISIFRRSNILFWISIFPKGSNKGASIYDKVNRYVIAWFNLKSVGV